MLVLSRRKGERINIGAEIEVVVVEVRGNRVRLGLVAPAELPIRREELPAATEWTHPEGPAGVARETTESIGI